MKRVARKVLNKLGLDVRRHSGVQFGQRWEYDARCLMGSRATHATFLDVGANIGQTALTMAENFSGARIYSFEPVPATFAELRKNTAHLPRVECVNAALSDSSGEAMITTDRDGQNTLLPNVTSSSGRANVRVSTVDDFCAQQGIERIDLLKTDTEGYETSVLRGAHGMFERGRIDFVLAECDFHRRPDEPHGDFFEIHRMLDSHGFRVVGFYNGGVDGQGWVWGDVLMMRAGVADGMPVAWSPINVERLLQ
jgi:FkbM family methyltransferase